MITFTLTSTVPHPTHWGRGGHKPPHPPLGPAKSRSGMGRRGDHPHSPLAAPSPPPWALPPLWVLGGGGANLGVGSLA